MTVAVAGDSEVFIPCDAETKVCTITHEQGQQLAEYIRDLETANLKMATIIRGQQANILYYRSIFGLCGRDI